MVLHTNAPPPLLLLIGAAFLAGAAALAWFSAMATLHLTRVDPAGVVRVEFETRLFGLILIDRERIDGVRSAERALSISSARRFSEAVRFAAAQLGAMVLAAFGALLIYLGVRAIFPDPNEGIGPI